MTTLTGYAATTGQPYDLGAFTEVIRPGAFRATLGTNPDVELNLNHGTAGSGLPLARTTSGTMRLSEDSRGLKVEADLDDDDPDTQTLVRKMKRGDVNAMSFKFYATQQTWNDDFTRREIVETDLNGGDCSVVTHPANPTTSASLTYGNADGLADPPIAGSTASRSRGSASLEQRRKMATEIGREVRLECRDWRIDDRPLLSVATSRLFVPDHGIEARLAAARARVRSSSSAQRTAHPTVARPQLRSVPNHTDEARRRLASLRAKGGSAYDAAVAASSALARAKRKGRVPSPYSSSRWSDAIDAARIRQLKARADEESTLALEKARARRRGR
jgi:HK97 family phage prohead protease